MKYSAKRIIAIASVFCLALTAMSGCGRKADDVSSEQKTSKESVSVSSTEAESTTNDVTEDEMQSEAKTEMKTDKSTTKASNEAAYSNWVDAYKAYLKDNKSKLENPEEASFSLHYITSDNIPELVISDGSYHSSGASIISYSAKDKKCVKIIDEIGSNGMFFYEEMTGCVVGTYAGMGTRYTDVRKIEGLSAKKVYESHATFPEFLMPGGIEQYKVNQKEVSREEYEEQYNKYVPKKLKIVEVPDYHFSPDDYSDGYEIAKDISITSGGPSYLITADNINRYIK